MTAGQPPPASYAAADCFAKLPQRRLWHRQRLRPYLAALPTARRWSAAPRLRDAGWDGCSHGNRSSSSGGGGAHRTVTDAASPFNVVCRVLTHRDCSACLRRLSDHERTWWLRRLTSLRCASYCQPTNADSTCLRVDNYPHVFNCLVRVSIVSFMLALIIIFFMFLIIHFILLSASLEKMVMCLCSKIH